MFNVDVKAIENANRKVTSTGTKAVGGAMANPMAKVLKANLPITDPLSPKSQQEAPPVSEVGKDEEAAAKKKRNTIIIVVVAFLVVVVVSLIIWKKYKK